MKLVEILNKKKKIGKRQKFHNIKNKKNDISKENQKADFDIESLKSDNVRRRKSIIDYEKDKEVRMQKKIEIDFEREKEKEKVLIIQSDKQLINTISNEDKDKDTNTNTNSEFKRSVKNKEKQKQKNKERERDDKILDDYELNHLEYEEAIEKDKRGFCKIYWSILKRDELILFTFISWNDYNLFNIKIERFIFIILNIMAMNGFLFADKSIHNLYLNGVNYDFVQQILQIVLSVIITHVLEIFLCFLSMTDRYIYEIKALPKSERTGEKMFEILKRMKIRLIAFLVSLLFVSIFYWYFISSFCAVYSNTQGMYILDCVLSFAILLIDPFLVYALVTVLRKISIYKVNNKKLKCLYIVSRLFPAF